MFVETGQVWGADRSGFDNQALDAMDPTCTCVFLQPDAKAVPAEWRLGPDRVSPATESAWFEDLQNIEWRRDVFLR